MHKKTRERMKSVVLAGMLLLSLFLVIQLWFGKYYMPGSSEIETSVDRWLRQPVMRLFHLDDDTIEFSDSLQTVMKAQRILLNTTGTRQLITEEDASYNNLYATIQDLTATILNDPSRILVRDVMTEEDWLNALKSDSIYVDYGVEANARLFSVAMGGGNRNVFVDSVAVMRDYIIGMSDAADRLVLMIKDYKDGSIYRFTVAYNKAALESDIKVHSDTVNINSPSYAFELNFHKATNDDGSLPRVIFDPLILVNTFPSEKAVMRRVNLFTPDSSGQLEPHTEAQILKMFNINSNTMRRYTDVSGAGVYVENYANLEIHPGGYLHYSVVEGNRGLKLTDEDKTSYTVYDAVNMGVTFLRSITSSLEKDQFAKLRISSQLTENSMKNGVYTLTLDYYVEGIPVLYWKDGAVSHSVIMEIENGYLKNYRHYFNYFDDTGETTTTESMIPAVDKFVEGQPIGEPIRLSNVFLGYVNLSENRTEQRWCIAVAGDPQLYVVE